MSVSASVDASWSTLVADGRPSSVRRAIRTGIGHAGAAWTAGNWRCSSSRVSVSPSTGCWEWSGGCTADGYGELRWDGRVEYAHRIAYRVFVGDIPSNCELDHLCRVRHCVNPAHLEAVTHAENCRRGDHRTGHWNLRKTHCPAGHPYDEKNTRRKPGGARACRACEREARRRRSVCLDA